MWRKPKVGFQLVENKVLFPMNGLHNTEEERRVILLWDFSLGYHLEGINSDDHKHERLKHVMQLNLGKKIPREEKQ